jgi:hypothetical protein
MRTQQSRCSFAYLRLPEVNGPGDQEQRQFTNKLGEWLDCLVETEMTRLCAPSGTR